MSMKHFILLILLIAFNISSEEITENQKNRSDSNFSFAPTKMDVLKIAYWSSYSSVGAIGFFNMIGQTANAKDISDKLLSINDRINNLTGSELIELRTFATSYPLIIFGLNSIMAGSSFIPVVGGLVFGTLNYSAAILLSCLSSIYTFRMPYFTGYSGYSNDPISEEIVEVNNRLLDPTPYFAVGTVSIIMGVAELILYFHYQREVRRNKYPYFQRIITLIPGGIQIGLKI